MSGAHANAGAWDWSSRASLSSIYNDNPTLRDDDRDTDSTFRMLAVYAMQIRWAEQNKNFQISPRVTRDYYPDSDDSDLESTDYFLPGQFAFTSPTTSTNVSFNASRQNILSDDLTILSSADSSNFRADDTQHTYSVGGTFTWSPTPRGQIAISGNAAKIDYDLDFTGRSDYDFYAASASYRRALTPRQTLGFTAGFNRFTSVGDNCINNTGFFPLPSPSSPPCGSAQINVKNDNDNDSYSFTLDYGVQLTDILNLDISFGRQKSESTSSIRDVNNNYIGFDPIFGLIFVDGPTDSDSKGEAYDIALSGQYERGSFSLIGERSVRPSSDGSAQDRTELSFNGDYRLSRTLTTELSLRVLEQQSVLRESDDNLAPDRKTRYYYGELRLNWRLNRDWSLNAGYDYRWRDEDAAPGLDVDSQKATSNAVRLGVTYYFRQLR